MSGAEMDKRLRDPQWRYIDPAAGPDELCALLFGLSQDDGSRIARADTGAGARRFLVLDQAEQRTRLLAVGSGSEASARDYSGAPGAAAIWLVGMAQQLVRGTLEYLSAGIDDATLSAEQKLICLTNPLLRGAADRGMQVPAFVPEPLASILQATSLGEAVSLLAGQPASATKRTRRVFGTKLVQLGSAAFRGLSIARAASGLEPDDVAAVLEGIDGLVGVDQVVPSSAAKQAAQRWLRRWGRERWRDLLVACQHHEDGARLVRLLASVEDDVFRDVDVRDVAWMHARASEVVTFPAAPTDPLAWRLRGRTITGVKLRLRVVQAPQEFASVGRSMRNCLQSYGPQAVTRGATIVIAIDEHGTARHAIEVDRGARVVAWRGPGNTVPDATQRTAIAQVLTSAGVTVPSRLPDQVPF